MKEDLPYPKRRKRSPVVLSPEEVQRLIAGAKNLYHRTLRLTLYGNGLRRREVCRLKVRDIDSPRMLLRVEQGKGYRDRDVPLSPTLLAALARTRLGPSPAPARSRDTVATSTATWRGPQCGAPMTLGPILTARQFAAVCLILDSS